MEEQFVETSHGKIAFYDSQADGLPVIMVHANSICKESFKPQIKALAGKYRTIAIDLPGHGQSSDAIDPRRSYRMGGYAEAVSELLSKLDVNRFALFGHSLGGHVALEMLASDANPVAGVIAFGTPPIANTIEGLSAGFLPSPEMAYTGSSTLTEEQVVMTAKMAVGVKDGLDDLFLSAIRRTDGRAREYMIADAYAGKTTNQRQTVETSPTPLMIINGAEDPVVNLDYIDSLSYQNVWSSRPIRLTGTGHAAHREKANDFNFLLVDFLDGIS